MKYYFLPEDLSALGKIIEGLHQKLKELGKEQGEAARQSTENMGHDDACQESVQHARQIVVARLQELQKTASRATIANPIGPFRRVQLGATVELSDGRTYRIGSFMVLAEHEAQNISYASPLARALMHKEVGDEVEFRGNNFTITRVS